MSKNDYITGEELRQIISFAKENGYTIEEAIDIYRKEVRKDVKRSSYSGKQG